MGLDMYAFTVDPGLIGDRTIDIKLGELEEKAGEDALSKLYYWRKHPDLHGWMERLYRDRGGENEFNCNAIVLTLEDLDKLESDVTTGRLPATSGFFFGASHAEDIEGDKEFIALAREALRAGKTVVYDSWW